jgi:hypothetical protein
VGQFDFDEKVAGAAVEPTRLSQRKQGDSQLLGMVVFKLER